MKKLNLAIIGQGRSGRNIHGAYLKAEANIYYNVKYVVDLDEFRRGVAEEEYPGCQSMADYRELYNYSDIDLVVNATYSEMHYSITRDLLLHGMNVLVEKPFARTRYECEELIKIARENNVVLAVFQQSFLAPHYLFSLETIKSGLLGDIKQINLRYSGFSRRWDWQTLQKKCAGSTYNTGPHPIGMALGFLDFDEHAEVIFSRLDTALTSGDADDYAKIIITAPSKPVMDVEISSVDAYSDYNVKVMGSLGTLKTNTDSYEITYIKDGENPERPVIEEFLKNEEGRPIYCNENLVKHTEKGDYSGNAFTTGTSAFYKELYFKITEGKPMSVTPEMAARIIGVIEEVTVKNPLPVKY